MARVVVHTRLRQEALDVLDEVARQTGSTRAEVIRVAIGMAVNNKGVLVRRVREGA